MNSIKHFFSNMIRIIQWIPILWKDRDWDHGFLTAIVIFKLQRIRDDIKKRNITWSTKRTEKQINYALFLIDQIQEDVPIRFASEAEQLRNKWGELEFRDRRLTYSKAITEENKKSARDEFFVFYNKTEAYQAKLRQRLARHLLAYYECWWD